MILYTDKPSMTVTIRIMLPPFFRLYLPWKDPTIVRSFLDLPSATTMDYTKRYNDVNEVYDNTTTQERARVRFLYGLVPRFERGAPNRAQVNIPKEVWKVQFKTVIRYETKLTRMVDHWERTGDTCPHGEEMMYYFAKCYLIEKMKYDISTLDQEVEELKIED